MTMQGETPETDAPIMNMTWIDAIQEQVKAFYREIDQAGKKSWDCRIIGKAKDRNRMIR